MHNIPSEFLNASVQSLSKLPGVGEKTALRLSLFLLKKKKSFLEKISSSIKNLSEIKLCPKCFFLENDGQCVICYNPLRKVDTICVVQDIPDVLAIESIQAYRGLYHVLGGIISPSEGVYADHLTIENLTRRVNHSVQEVILALNSGIDGETTSLYIYNSLKSMDIKISILSKGISEGEEIRYSNQNSLSSSFKNRVPFEKTFFDE